MVYQHKLQEFFIISTVLKKKADTGGCWYRGVKWDMGATEPVALVASHECRI